jgi:hypothetical protein
MFETGDLNGDDENAFNVANKLAAAEAERASLDAPGLETDLFERAESLPASPVQVLASIAGLAYGYALKAEDGTASWLDLGTLTSHCKVLADDLYEMAGGSWE